MPIKKIISGGQTGADQAGLDVAITHDIPHGGSIPKGRRTEAGVLPDRYQLEEMATDSYPKRTEKNVVDSDGTVILTHGKLTGGSLFTWKKALEHDKPVIHLDMEEINAEGAVGLLEDFIAYHGIETLNVAGTRASEDALIYQKTHQVIEGALGR